MIARNKIVLALGLVIVLVVAGSSAASALWHATISATSTVRAASLSDSCTDVTSVVNASFEEPVISTLAGSPSISQTPEAIVPGWVSNPEHIIEIWNQNNYLGIAPPVGNQFVELNASVAGTLSQTIATTPGQVLQWSLLHRGRAGVDTMDVLIGPAGGTQVSQGNISDGTAAWVRYSGAYVVPAGQTSTQISFRAVSTATGDQSIGNFLDDVSFGSGPCLDISSTATNFTDPDDIIRGGDQIEYVTTIKNIGSSPSFQTIMTNTIPAGLDVVTNSIRIGATATTTTTRTDANDTDSAKLISKALTAYLGTSATSTAGGSIAQGSQVVVRFLVTAPAATTNGTTFSYTPTVNYVNQLAPNWGRSATADNVPVTVTTGTDLSLTVSAPATANVTDASSWVFTLRNNGNVIPAANTAKVRLTVPAAFATTLATGTGVTCVVVATPANTQDCTVTAAFAVDSTRTITLTRTHPVSAVGASYTVAGVASSTGTDPITSNNSASATTVVDDTENPTRPGQPTTTGANYATSVTFSWAASTDNVAVAFYDIYRNGVLDDSVAGNVLTYTDRGLNPGTGYSYTVVARDAAGNTSTASLARTRTTLNWNTTNANTPIYKLVNANGLCLDASGSGTGTGTQVLQYTCGTQNNQNWKVFVNGSPWLSLQPAYSNNLVIDIDGNTGRAQLWTNTPSANQQWSIINQNNGTYRLQLRSNGLCLTSPNNTSGTQLVTATCVPNAANQSFAINGN